MTQEILRTLPWASAAAGGFFPGSARWSDLKGPEGGEIVKVFWSSRQPGRLWAGSYAGDLFLSESDSGSWNRRTPPLNQRSQVTALIPSQGAAHRFLAGYYSGDVMGTEDMGVTWKNCSQGMPRCPIHTMVEHPVHPALVLAGTDNGLYLSANGGISWSRFPTTLPYQKFTAVCFHPTNPLVFWIAFYDTLTSGLLMTSDGGQTFIQQFNGTGRFHRIHTILTCTDSKALWISGSGGQWGVACNPDGSPDGWKRIDTGLPAGKVTCLAGDPSNTLWTGTDGSGIFSLKTGESQWILSDSNPDHQSVKSLSARNGQVAAGYSNSGVAVLTSGNWQPRNAGLHAKTVSAVAGKGSLKGAVSRKALYTHTATWKRIMGFNHVRDIMADQTGIWVASYLDGIFCLSDPAGNWTDMGCPRSETVKIASEPDGHTVMAVSVLPGGPILIHVKQSGSAPWNQLGPSIHGPLEVYDAAFALIDGTIHAAIAAIGGVYSYQQNQDRWHKTATSGPFDIRNLAVSQVSPGKIYAGSQNRVMVSTDGGITFESHGSTVFPSHITALTTHGPLLDTIWAGTRNGGVYVSFLDNEWMSLVPDESGIQINRLSPDIQHRSRVFIATEGVSCTQAELPAISLCHRTPVGNPTKRKLYLTMQNPCSSLHVDFHLIRIRPGTTPVFYRFENGTLVPESDPVPYAFVMAGNTQFPETLLGEIDTGESNTSPIIIAGLFAHGSWHAVTSLALATDGGASQV
jgi:ligand-binding sensor domain-containing protein